MFCDFIFVESQPKIQIEPTGVVANDTHKMQFDNQKVVKLINCAVKQS